MGALDNGFRLKPDTQPIDGDVLLYDAASDSMRAGGAIPGAVGVTKAAAYSTASGVVAATTTSAEINSALRVQHTVPASGNVLVDMRAWVVSPASSGAGISYFWTPRVILVSNSAQITAPACRVAFTATSGDILRQGWVGFRRIIGGLTAGTLVEVQWYHNASAGTSFDVRPDSSTGQAMSLSVVTL